MSPDDLIKVLLIGGPKDGEMIMMRLMPSIHFGYPLNPTVGFSDMERMTLREPLKMFTYNIEPISGRELVRYIGVYEDMDWDQAIAQILGRYAK